MNLAYIQLGSNLGDRLGYLQLAMKLINNKAGSIARESEIYESEAWGFEDQPDFLNILILIETTLSPRDLLNVLQEIEKQMGRTKIKKWSPRTIDIDILFYNQEIIDQPGLKIPHPFISERRFVLVPMNELNSGFIHPVSGRAIAEILSECIDSQKVWIYNTPSK